MARQYDFGGNNDFKERTKNKEEKYKIWNTVTIVLIILLFVIPIFISANSTDGFSSDQSEYHNSEIIELCLFVALLFSTAQGHKNNPESEKVSITGKQTISQQLNVLNDNYVILSDVHLFSNGDDSLYDFIVLSPKSIHVIVTNNRNGYIYGTKDDKNWRQHKIGEKGGEYDKYFTNPIKKLHFQQLFLKNALYTYGIKTKIAGYVIMPMAINVYCSDSEMAMNLKELLNDITRDKTGNYKKNDIQKIINAIQGMTQKEAPSANPNRVNTNQNNMIITPSEQSKRNQSNDDYTANILRKYKRLKRKGLENLTDKELALFAQLESEIKKIQ